MELERSALSESGKYHVFSIIRGSYFQTFSYEYITWGYCKNQEVKKGPWLGYSDGGTKERE